MLQAFENAAASSAARKNTVLGVYVAQIPKTCAFEPVFPALRQEEIESVKPVAERAEVRRLAASRIRAEKYVRRFYYGAFVFPQCERKVGVRCVRVFAFAQ